LVMFLLNPINGKLTSTLPHLHNLPLNPTPSIPQLII
jgi:hypothetical protein